MDIKIISDKFKTDGDFVGCVKYGRGHINDTYLAKTDTGARYIVQRINDKVFLDVDGLMENITGVTGYIAERSDAPSDELLTVIGTKDGTSYYKCAEGYFRVYNFIEKGVSVETAPTAEQLTVAGSAFGGFMKLLAGYPAEKLHETIKGFHDTEARFAQLSSAVKNDVRGRVAGVLREIDEYVSRRGYCGAVNSLIKSGDIPLRVTHNDTKLNNVLIDVKNMRAVAVIDLDTIMAGSVLFDFGDSIRSGANVGSEDGSVPSRFSIELFEAFARGFLPPLKGELTSDEIENMAFGAILMTYECGMRFLTDYLCGDVYFKTSHENENLDRTRSQMRLVCDMEAALPEMNGIVKKILK